MTLSKAERIAVLTSKTVSYSPTLATALGSTSAAILFAHAVDNPRDGGGWRSVDHESLGMTTREKTNAVTTLAQFGIADAEMTATCLKLRIKWSAFDDLANDTVEHDDATEEPPLNIPETQDDLFPQIGTTPDEIRNQLLSGIFDTLPKTKQMSTSISNALLELWCEEWGKQKNKAKLTTERMKHYRRALNDGYKPSEFARAIIGMRCDPWLERHEYCDWSAVTKQLPKWLGFYSALTFEGKTKVPLPVKLPFKTTIIHGVMVPLDYPWDMHDDRCAEDGRRFDPRTKKWHEQTSDQFDELERFNMHRSNR